LRHSTTLNTNGPPAKGMYVMEYGESTKNKENNSFVEKIMMGKKKL
jgi:hypothetical protein